MTSNAGCWTRRLAILAIATSLLTACATGVSDPRIITDCPPVVDYSREFQAQAAEELDLLPESSVIGEMLSDYAVMRDQGKAAENGHSVLVQEGPCPQGSIVFGIAPKKSRLCQSATAPPASASGSA